MIYSKDANNAKQWKHAIDYIQGFFFPPLWKVLHKYKAINFKVINMVLSE